MRAPSRPRPLLPGSPLLAAILLAVSSLPAGAQFRFDRGGAFLIGRDPEAVALADIDWNGVLDVVAISTGDDRLSLHLGRIDPATGAWLGTPVKEDSTRGDETSGGYDGGPGASPPAPNGFATLDLPVDVVAADFNRDGVADVAIAERNARTVSIRLGVPTGTFRAPTTFAIGDAPRRLRIADLDDDGLLDLLVVGDHRAHVAFGNRRTLFEPPVPLRSSNFYGFDAADVADVDGDGDLDIVATAESLAGIAELYTFSCDGGREYGLPEAMRFHPDVRGIRDLRAVDIDADGRSELIAATLHPGLYVRPARGAGEARFLRTGDSAFSIDSADFDGDGFTDLLTTNTEPDGTIGLLLADGRGSLEAPIRLQAGFNLRKPSIADIDRDGRIDIAAPAVGFDATERGTFELYFDRSLPSFGAGSVNAGRGTIVDLLTVNGTHGGPARHVTIRTWSRIEVALAAPPASSRRAPFALFAWEANPARSEGASQPHGIGVTSLPTPLSGGSPQPVFVFDSTGTAWACRSLLSPKAPCVLVDRPFGLRHPVTVYLQGLILDPGSAGERPASVTNGVLLEIR